jgi:hypothetical protein
MLVPLIALTLVTCANLVSSLNGDTGNFGNGGIATLVTKGTSKKMVILVINMVMNIKVLLYYFDITQNFNISGSFSRGLHRLLRCKYVRW